MAQRQQQHQQQQQAVSPSLEDLKSFVLRNCGRRVPQRDETSSLADSVLLDTERLVSLAEASCSASHHRQQNRRATSSSSKDKHISNKIVSSANDNAAIRKAMLGRHFATALYDVLKVAVAANVVLHESDATGVPTVPKRLFLKPATTATTTTIAAVPASPFSSFQPDDQQQQMQQQVQFPDTKGAGRTFSNVSSFSDATATRPRGFSAMSSASSGSLRISLNLNSNNNNNSSSGVQLPKYSSFQGPKIIGEIAAGTALVNVGGPALKPKSDPSRQQHHLSHAHGMAMQQRLRLSNSGNVNRSRGPSRRGSVIWTSGAAVLPPPPTSAASMPATTTTAAPDQMLGASFANPHHDEELVGAGSSNNNGGNSVNNHDDEQRSSPFIHRHHDVVVDDDQDDDDNNDPDDGDDACPIEFDDFAFGSFKVSNVKSIPASSAVSPSDGGLSTHPLHRHTFYSSSRGSPSSFRLGSAVVPRNHSPLSSFASLHHAHHGAAGAAGGGGHRRSTSDEMRADHFEQVWFSAPADASALLEGRLLVLIDSGHANEELMEAVTAETQVIEQLANGIYEDDDAGDMLVIQATLVAQLSAVRDCYVRADKQLRLAEETAKKSQRKS